MNSSIALRLLWKEYRVQRGLWVSMAFGCFALQALIAFLIPSDQESFQGIVPIAFMLTSFYAIGSGSITFAIEREDGTQLRPVMLGCPPGLTLTIKIVFGIVTTALLLAITFSSGMLMTLGSLTLPENTMTPEVSGMLVPLALLFVGLPYLGCILWSTFFFIADPEGDCCTWTGRGGDDRHVRVCRGLLG
jgi:ABC-type transport system involved in cytochrome c biogenesis permease component